MTPGTRRGEAPLPATARAAMQSSLNFGRYRGETGGTFKAELMHVAEDDEGRG
jgi:hypothetical protein